ncbi:MAG: hypothetical protein HY747_09285 [Elusimicrobia bacterium]|nr:hypothetical protein [Elusimicrobiota bacterium]
MKKTIERFSKLMDELGPAGADLKPFIETAERSKRLSIEGKHDKAASLLEEAVQKMESLKSGAAFKAEPLKEDWIWPPELAAKDQTEPLANDLYLVVSDENYPHLAGFLEQARQRGVDIRRVQAEKTFALRQARVAVIIGNSASPDGVGLLLRKILNAKELSMLLVGPQIFIRQNVFRPRQCLFVLAAPYSEQMGSMAVENDSEIFLRVLPPLTKSGHPRFTKLYSAVSNDGLLWTQEKKLLINGVSVPEIVRLEKGWRLYFVDGLANIPNCAFSTDGKQWNPERFQVRNLAFSGMGVADPNIIRLDDGRWRLYFDSGFLPGREGNEGLLSAISNDGVEFVFEEGVRFTGQEMADPEVHKMGNIWRLYYPSKYAGQIATAISKDGGRTFAPETMLDIKSAGSFEIVPVKGGWRMYYNAGRGMEIVFSKDGLTWTKEGEVPFSGANPAVTELPDGGWRMYFIR